MPELCPSLSQGSLRPRVTEPLYREGEWCDGGERSSSVSPRHPRPPRGGSGGERARFRIVLARNWRIEFQGMGT